MPTQLPETQTEAMTETQTETPPVIPEPAPQAASQAPATPQAPSPSPAAAPLPAFPAGVRFVDLFCGVGGFRVAMQNACAERGTACECVFSSDIDKDCREVYAKNFGELPAGDINGVAPAEIPDFDVLVGGFPCQPFSIIGSGKGFEDARGTLFFSIARILEAKRPAAFVLENVKRLCGHDGGRTIARIMAVLRDLGYAAEYRVLNALDFGLPQNRTRVFIAGVRMDGAANPAESAEGKPGGRECPPRVPSVAAQALNDGSLFSPSLFSAADAADVADAGGAADADAGKKNRATPASASASAPALPESFHWPEGGIPMRPLAEILEPETDPFYDASLAIRINRAAQTAALADIPKPGIWHENKSGHVSVHPFSCALRAGSSYNYLLVDGRRRLTGREMFRLQGFPDSFKIAESYTVARRQAGNSLPVPVAQAVIASLLLMAEKI